MTGKAGRNEQRKITATAVNNVAVSMFVTGVVVPIVGGSGARPPYWFLFMLLWVTLALATHVTAQLVAKGIEE